jgi:hypothetical protein
MITSRLLFFYKKTSSSFLKQTLFHRHRVSESQYRMLNLNELPRIVTGCKEALERKVHDAADRPKITVLNVWKAPSRSVLP